MSAYEHEIKLYSKGAMQMTMTRQPRYTSARGAFLLALAGSTFMTAAPAFAQTAPATAQAQAPADDQATKPTGNPEEITVTATRKIGGGLMKVQTAAEAMSSITPAAIEEKLSAASPLQLANTLPGVNLGGVDAYGLSVLNFVSVRGLDETEIGYMIENIPGVDNLNYFPYTESWVDNENISDITLTPGNSRLQDPIISASGGEFIVGVRQPNDKFGGMLSGSGGSFNAWRGFGAIDTGYIGQTGAKAFASYSHTSVGNFAGPGTSTRNHVDFKGTVDWSPKAHSSLFVSYSNLVNARIPFVTLAQAKDGIDNGFEKYFYSPTFTPGVTTSFYKPFIVNKKNLIVAFNNDIELSDNLTLHVTPYFKYTGTFAPGESIVNPASTYNGNQLVTPAYGPSQLQNGKLFLKNGTTASEYQPGVVVTLDADLSPTNHLIVGYWHETWRVNYISFYNILDQSGDVASSLSNALRASDGSIISPSHYSATTNTNQLIIGDTQSFFDEKLKISLGFKQLFYSLNGVNKVVGGPPSFSTRQSKAMPRILVSYDVSPNVQIYANATTNTRMPLVRGTYVTNYSTTSGAVTQAPNPGQKPEYSISSQFGFRYQGLFNLDANAFYMHQLDHQLSSLQVVNGVLLPTAFSIGDETIKGFSVEASTHSYGGFSAYGNAQYLHATFDDNAPVGTSLGSSFLPTKGKKMVDSPDWIVGGGIRYEHGPFYMQVTGKYVSSQYTTLMNDQVMPSYTTFDLGMGYKFPEFGPLSKSAIRLSVTNLGNKSYIASRATVATNAVPTTALNGATVAAGTPLYYVGAPRAAMLTLSTNF